jgi:hypothetical protein
MLSSSFFFSFLGFLVNPRFCALLLRLANPRFQRFIGLLTQTVCSLMAQEKQMPAAQSLVFLLRSLYHISP